MPVRVQLVNTIAASFDRHVTWSNVIFRDDVTPIKVHVSIILSWAYYLHEVEMNRMHIMTDDLKRIYRVGGK
jgi:hypothetical protein